MRRLPSHQMLVGMARTLRVALVVLLVGAATAVAAEITRAPRIHGETSVGKLLQATAGEWTPADATPAYVWVRCSSSATADCTPIDGACSRRHVVLPADAGDRLRIRLTVADATGQTVSVLSRATRVIPAYNLPAPGDPGVAAEPDTCTKVTPTGPGSGSFESGTQPEPVTPAPQVHSTPLIDPFPLVRISGRFHKRFTRVTRVAVR